MRTAPTLRANAVLMLALCAMLPCTNTALRLQFVTTTRPASSARVAPVIATADESSSSSNLSATDAELLAYWKKHSAKWETPLRMMDVSTAWEIGELDGLLPSGQPSRVATSERMLSLGRAMELFEKDELSVRRRFRSMTPVEFAPRWDRVMATRARLQAAGTYDDILRESDKARAFQRAQVRGEVEDADASPAVSRLVATILSPALKAASTQRARADGGMSLAFATLLETAGDTPAERWLTAVLLAELEAEIKELTSSSASAAKSSSDGATPPSFSQVEAQRDVDQANSLGVIGIGVALVFVLAQFSLVSGGDGLGSGGADSASLQRTLDLMQ